MSTETLSVLYNYENDSDYDCDINESHNDSYNDFVEKNFEDLSSDEMDKYDPYENNDDSGVYSIKLDEDVDNDVSITITNKYKKN